MQNAVTIHALAVAANQARAALNTLHELAWDTPDPSLAPKVAATLRQHLFEIDHVVRADVLASSLDRIQKIAPANLAATIFEVFDPLIALVDAACSEAQGKRMEAAQASWHVIDSILISLGSAIVGFDFVEPWAHQKTENTKQYLERLRDPAIASGIEPALFDSIAASAEDLEANLGIVEINDAAASTNSKQASRSLIDASRALSRTHQSGPAFAVWETFPAQLISLI